MLRSVQSGAPTCSTGLQKRNQLADLGKRSTFSVPFFALITFKFIYLPNRQKSGIPILGLISYVIARPTSAPTLTQEGLLIG